MLLFLSMKRQHENLIVWKEAHALCLRIYKYTSLFPDREKFGIISQMRKSSYSIPTNIAEGNGHRSIKEKLRYINIANASLEELHYQCTLSKDLGYLSTKDFQALDDMIQRIGYLLMRLRASRFSSSSSPSFSSSHPSSSSSSSSS